MSPQVLDPFVTLLWPTVLSLANGIFICLAFACFSSVRRNPLLRAVALLYVVSCVSLYLSFTSVDQTTALEGWLLFMLAVLGYVPVLIYLGYASFANVLEALLSSSVSADPRSERLHRWQKRLKRALRRRERTLLARKLQKIQQEPENIELRRETIDLCLGLEETDQALYHAYALVDFAPQGQSHAFALYKLAQILAENLGRLEAAQPYLRSIIRLYPRSYFASYARRLVNKYEAYADREA